MPTEIVYFPRWGTEGEVESEQETCIRGSYYSIVDTNVHALRSQAEAYQEANIRGHLYPSLEECCATHYWWDLDACVASGGTFGNDSTIIKAAAFTFYYPDREGENKFCRNDGEQPAYMTNNFQIWMFNSVEDCCRTYYGGSSLVQFCNENSVISDTPLNTLSTPLVNRTLVASGQCFKRRCKYYPWWGWEGEVGSEVETCIIDGEEPEYMHEDPDTWMFDTLDACCETHFWWEVPSCTATGGKVQGNDARATKSGAFTLFYPIFDRTSCSNDGAQPAYMTDVFWIWMKSALDECCETYFPFNKNECRRNAAVVNTTVVSP